MSLLSRWSLLSLSSLAAVAAACGTTVIADDSATGPGRGNGSLADGGTPKPGEVLPDGASAVNGIEHILSTGQSNAIGFAATPPLSTPQAFGNLMFDQGVMTSAECDQDGCKRYEKPSAFVDLAEGDAYYADRVETMSSGLANQVSKMRGAANATASRILVSVHAKSGNTYWCLRKTGCQFLDGKGYVRPFEEGMMQVADAKALAATAGIKYAVRAVTAVHGESDHYAGQFPLDRTDGTAGSIDSYTDALLEWQRDYETAIREATGQTEAVPLFISQMANWNDTPHSQIPLRQLDAHAQSGGKVVMIGPTYHLPYAADCIHFTNQGERQLGEYFAKAYQRVVGEGGVWEPVRPKQVTAAGNVITVAFHVPRPPLVLDTKLVTDPGSFGFEVADGNGASLTIASVKLAGPEAVTIELAAGASAAGARVRYAYTAQPLTCPGPETGPRGNLRDSDDTASNGGHALYNWSVQFDAPVQ